ncbi:MAG: helix-turn-helix domain-containing protein [Parvibaculales bacterium]
MSDGETAATSEKIGGILRDAREAANATLDDISALLKIRSDHLQALENDDFERLPGSVYAIGFIRTYATHLELNAGELIERYKAAVAVPHLEDQGPNPQTEIEPISGALKIAIGMAAVFVVYILWLIAGGAGDDGINSRFAETAAPAREVPVDRPSQASPAKPSANQTVAAPQAPVAAAQTDTASADTAEAAVEVNEITPLGSQAAVNATVEIRAARRTWMRIESNEGRVLFSSIIRKSEGFTLADNVYTLATRDAGALEFFVNDVSVGSVGRRGQILTARKIERASILAKSR